MTDIDRNPADPHRRRKRQPGQPQGQCPAGGERRLQVRPDPAVRRAGGALQGKYKDKGFEVLGFPANDFGAQEPGTHEEIAEFCKLNYGVSFPLFAKADVTGPGQAAALCRADRRRAQKQGPATEFRERSRATA
jgi:hypothetical protein